MIKWSYILYKKGDIVEADGAEGEYTPAFNINNWYSLSNLREVCAKQ